MTRQEHRETASDCLACANMTYRTEDKMVFLLSGILNALLAMTEEGEGIDNQRDSGQPEGHAEPG